MKDKHTRATAQAIALPKLGQVSPAPFSENENFSGVESMKNISISIDSYRKLNRAHNVSFNMYSLLPRQEFNGAPLLWVPDIFSYIADDISDIKEEMKALGLFDEWLKQERNNLDKE